MPQSNALTDDDGLPVGFARAYNRAFAGQTADNMRMAACEDMIRAALSQPSPAVPFGYWHQGETHDESDFFLASESGDVRCENCVTLYASPQPTEPAQPPTQAGAGRFGGCPSCGRAGCLARSCEPVDMMKIINNMAQAKPLAPEFGKIIADNMSSLTAATPQPSDAPQQGAAEPEQQYGYDTAFYELASLMRIGAHSTSPEIVWREQMFPRLQAAFAKTEPVGTLDVHRFRGHLENTSFDYTGSLPDGTYRLYATQQPQPAEQGEDAADAARWREHVGKLDALVAYCPTCCEGKVATADMTRDEVIFQCGRTSGKSEAARAAQTQGGD